uniref:Protocadherin alpha n=1 Tax=Philodina roseola TaxID=96448 RepID=G3KGY1_PHIRO|nr:protocadherin alpha [Philodina roseola]
MMMMRCKYCFNTEQTHCSFEHLHHQREKRNRTLMSNCLCRANRREEERRIRFVESSTSCFCYDLNIRTEINMPYSIVSLTDNHRLRMRMSPSDFNEKSVHICCKAKSEASHRSAPFTFNLNLFRFQMFVIICLCFLQFVNSLEYSLIIEEKSSINRTIFQFTRPYELINNFQSSFQLTNENENLILTKLIDRDLWCSLNICNCDRCEFILEFRSINDRTMSTMNVTISDLNDHACQFLDIQQNISLSESIQIGHRFPLARAIDVDSGLNGQLTFQLLDHQEYFQLNIVNLSMNEYAIYAVVRRSFDRELKENYELIIEGRDQGFPQVKINRTKIQITILDENDNAPKFNQSEYSIQNLSEDTPIGTELLTIFANDVDKGLNGEIHYSIVVPSSQSSSFPFAINSSSGVVRLQSPLDFETSRSFRFLVRASDSGLSQSLFTDSWLSISLKDVNDCPVEIRFTPNERFRFKNEILFIHENIEIENLTLGFFRLNDRDSIPTKINFSLQFDDSNRKQFYEILPTNSPTNFLLNVRNGIFDREIQNEIHLNFIASDSLLTSFYNLTIRLLDLNDNPNEFPSNPIVFYVEETANYLMNENPPENDRLTIGYLTSIDRDEGENAATRYDLDANSFVRIDSQTGRLFLRQPLDREEISTIFLKGKATNIAEPKWSTEVQIEIHVTDVNDDIPQCSSPFERISIAEDFFIEKTLTKINATDRDDGQNGTINYSLTVKNSLWPFEIDEQTGEIYSKEKFDFETKEKYFQLEIHLEDRGFPFAHQRQNACLVEIFIENINDNRPELIDDDQRRIFIDLKKSFQNQIVDFHVRDADEPGNDQFRFRLINADEFDSLFSLTSNGSLRLTRPTNEIGLFNLKILFGKNFCQKNFFKIFFVSFSEDSDVSPQQNLINVTVAIGDSSISTLSNFDKILLKYSRPTKTIGLIIGLTISIFTLIFFVCLIFVCLCLRRHRQRHQAAMMTRKKLFCSSSQQLTSSGSTTTTTNTSIEHQIVSTILPINWHEENSSRSYNGKNRRETKKFSFFQLFSFQSIRLRPILERIKFFTCPMKTNIVEVIKRVTKRPVQHHRHRKSQ